MDAVEINTREEFLEHMKAYIVCTDMSEDVKKFAWGLYWIGKSRIATKFTINKNQSEYEVSFL